MTARTKRAVLNLSALGGALIAVSAWAVHDSAPQVLSAANQHWVPRDTFTDFRKDLLTELRELHRLAAVADSERRCDRGFRGYCR